MRIINIILTSILLSIFHSISLGQTTETFESNTTMGATSFSSNGINFNLGLDWTLNNIGGVGVEESDWFVDNEVDCSSGGTVGTLASDGTEFFVFSMWLYASDNCSNFKGADGSVTIHWFNGDIENGSGSTYTVNSSSGPSDAGFYEIDLTTGDKDACLGADSMTFTLNGSLTYLALDNFTWATTSTSTLTSVSTSIANPAVAENFTLTANDLTIAPYANFNWYDSPSGAGTDYGSVSPFTTNNIDTTTYYGRVLGVCDTLEESVIVNIGTDTIVYYEDFETGNTDNGTTFTSQAQSFTITAPWHMTEILGYGNESTSFFIDNETSSSGTEEGGSAEYFCNEMASNEPGIISTTDGRDIYFYSAWLYTANDCQTNTNGSVEVTWFKDGDQVKQTTYTVNSGDLITQNGYVQVDLTDGFTSCVAADEVRFATTGDGLNYIALDGLEWYKDAGSNTCNTRSGNLHYSSTSNARLSSPNIYPNPATDQLNIELQGTDSQAKVSVYNNTGILIET